MWSRVPVLFVKFRRFWLLPSADRRLLSRIALIVPLVEIGLRIMGFKRMLAWLTTFARTKLTVTTPAAEVERHRRLLFIFHKELPLASRCLARALTLWYLLRRRGITTDLRFGIRKQDGKLLAHAWVEYDGHPLTLDPDIEQLYEPSVGPVFRNTARAL